MAAIVTRHGTLRSAHHHGNIRLRSGPRVQKTSCRDREGRWIVFPGGFDAQKSLMRIAV